MDLSFTFTRKEARDRFMKIERINENQIRCTITREDLESRHIQLAELAYGTEKVRSLFQDMLGFASNKFGFDADETPLMIEAVPVSSETLVLIVTRIPFPEELDARFSTFSDFDDDFDGDFDFFDDDEYYFDDRETVSEPLGSAQDVLDIYHQVTSPSPEVEGVPDQESEFSSESDISDLTRIFEFSSLDDVIEVAKILGKRYTGPDYLYKGANGKYQLVLSLGQHSPELFNKVCNVLAEYGSLMEIPLGTENFIDEHNKLILCENAMEKLAGF